jgi:hypothetical protein
MKVLHWQQLGFPFGQPLGAGRGLALWAAPIATRNGEISITCLMGSIF